MTEDDPDPGEAAEGPTDRQRRSPWRTVAWVLGGVLVAVGLVAVGVVLWFMAAMNAWSSNK